MPDVNRDMNVVGRCGFRISREGAYYVVRQRRRFVGKRRTLVGARRLMDESGGGDGRNTSTGGRHDG